MPKVLVVEDSKAFSSILRTHIEAALPFSVVLAPSLADARVAVESAAEPFFASLLDLNLPDAPNGEVVDYIIGQKIPAIVFTGDLDAAVRENTWSKRVTDYVLKESIASVDYLVRLLGRLHRNRSIKVLVVDDSNVARSIIMDMLEVNCFQIVEACDGASALEALEKNPDIRMVISDHMMPDMDGCELTRRIRRTHSLDKLSVIGMSAQGNQSLSARFIKNGANDFLAKPFSKEEFSCRVNQNAELLDLMEEIRNLADRDSLTQLYNRRFLFKVGEELCKNARRGNLKLTAAMIDIDNFKRINDLYGHDTGDKVIIAVADILRESVRESDLVARVGGEEYCVLLTSLRLDAADVWLLFERIREKVAQLKLRFGEAEFGITVSIGVCTMLRDSLNDMLIQADQALYEAKNQGRDRVVVRNA